MKPFKLPDDHYDFEHEVHSLTNCTDNISLQGENSDIPHCS